MRFSQAARRHEIAKGRARFVIANTEATESIRDDGTREVRWYGPDDRGLNLDIVGIVKPDRSTGEPMLLIIHVMPEYPKE